jgi:hypothetical protein
METCHDEDQSASPESFVDIEDRNKVVVGVTKVPLTEFGIDKLKVRATTIGE